MYHKSEFYNKGMLSAHPETSVLRTGKPKAGGCHIGSREGSQLCPSVIWAPRGPSRGPGAPCELCVCADAH